VGWGWSVLAMEVMLEGREGKRILETGFLCSKIHLKL